MKIISNVTTSRAEDLIITIKISRTTTIIVIKTENLRNGEEVIGTTVVVRVHIRALLGSIRALLEPILALVNKLQNLMRHKQLSLSSHMMSQSIHVGRSLLSNIKITTIVQAAMAANGTNSVVGRLTTLFRCPVMSVLSWNFLEQQTRALILASTKTFPWRRRAVKCRNTLHHLMTLS